MNFYQNPTLLGRLQDLGDDRLRAMDLIGLDMMVLSVTTPATQALPPDQAVPLARQTNDQLAATVKPPDPAAAVGLAAGGQVGGLLASASRYRSESREASRIGIFPFNCGIVQHYSSDT